MAAASSSSSSSPPPPPKFDLRLWQEGVLSSSRRRHHGGDGFAAATAAAPSFSRTCFAEYWDALPVVADNRHVQEVDPYNFYHRVSLGKLLVERTTASSGPTTAAATGAASDCRRRRRRQEVVARHWYWAYLAQLDWQRRAGRLRTSTLPSPSPSSSSQTRSTGEAAEKEKDDDDDDDDGAISYDSWFGYMNLNFTLAVYYGAVRAGVVSDGGGAGSGAATPAAASEDGADATTNRRHHHQQQLDMERRLRSQFLAECRGCCSPEDVEELVLGYRRCVEYWYDFWNTSWRRYYDFDGEGEGGGGMSESDLYRALWDTHTDVVRAGLKAAVPLERLLVSSAERQFAKGWCSTVELLAAMNWNGLSLEALLEHGAGFLPSRVLEDDDLVVVVTDATEDDDRNGGAQVCEKSALLSQRKRRLLPPKELEAVRQIVALSTIGPTPMRVMCLFWSRLSYWEFERLRLPRTLKCLTSGPLWSPSSRRQSLYNAFIRMLLVVRIVAMVFLPHTAIEFLVWVTAFTIVLLKLQF